MEDMRAKDQNNIREDAVAEAVKELSESLIATNEAMGSLLYMLSYGKWKMPEAGVRHGEEARPRPLGTDDIPHKPEVGQSVSVGPDDYEAVKHITVKDAVRQILDKSVFQIPEDSISFRKGDGQCIEFRSHQQVHRGVLRVRRQRTRRHGQGVRRACSRPVGHAFPPQVRRTRSVGVDIGGTDGKKRSRRRNCEVCRGRQRGRPCRHCRQMHGRRQGVHRKGRIYRFGSLVCQEQVS